MIVPLERLPGIPAIARDYMNQSSNALPFFSGHYKNRQAFERTAGKVGKYARTDQKNLTLVLLEQNMSYGCGELTLENIKKLSSSDVFVVATGQQVGLFTGPLYTIYKALSTIKMAQNLAQQLRVPVLPLFYLVSEDHDYEEVRWAGLMNRGNRLIRFEHEAPRENDRQPVSRIMINDSILSLFQSMEAETPETEYKKTVLTTLKSCYGSGTPFHTAFARWFTRLFSQYGVICFDSSDRRLKQPLKGIFELELKENLTVKAMMETNSRLEKKRYQPQINIHPGRPGLFHIHNGRQGLERVGERFRNLGSGEEYAIDQLVPEQLSPKAALRPIVEDTLFPTIAYVGGPNEIAYWAQLKGVYQSFGLPMPVVVPRCGFTLIEPKIKRHLTRFSLNPLTALLDQKKAARHVLGSLVPDRVQAGINSIKNEIDKGWPEIIEGLAGVEPSLKAAAEKTRHSFTFQLDVLEEKTIKAVRRRESILTEQLGAVFEHLLPGGKLQERQLNILHFLFKYDWPFLEMLYNAIDMTEPNHKLLEL